ncbi:MAG: hypothetical protein ACTSPV_15915 [Candidatus Hodarchaeales archaeon]
MSISDYSLASKLPDLFDNYKLKENINDLRNLFQIDLEHDIAMEVFEDFYEEFFTKIMNDKQKFKTILRLIEGINGFFNEHYRTSYVLLWFIIESYISTQFVEFSNKVKRKEIVPKSRRKELLKFSSKKDQIWVAKKIAILDENDYLNIPRSHLDTFRDIRNDIVHQWATIDRTKCQDILKFIKDHSKEIFGIFLPFNEHIYSQGL